LAKKKIRYFPEGRPQAPGRGPQPLCTPRQKRMHTTSGCAVSACAPAPPTQRAEHKKTRPWTGTGYCDSDTAPRGTTLNCPGVAGTTRSRNGADRPTLLNSGWLLRGEFTVLSCAGIPPSPVLYRTETATTPLHCMWGIEFFESLNGNTRPMTSQSDFAYAQPRFLSGRSSKLRYRRMVPQPLIIP
jgi:hypothetical protein